MKSILFGLALLLTSAAFGADVGDTVPCIDLKTLAVDGTLKSQCLTGRENEGQFLVLEFFQTTCGACVANLPNLKKLSLETEPNALFRYVAIDRDESRVFTFVAKHKDEIRFEVPLDSSRVATRAFGIEYTPTLFVVDSYNKIVFKHVGTLDDASMAEIKRLVGVGQ